MRGSAVFLFIIHGKGSYTTANDTRFESVREKDESAGSGIARKKDGSRYTAEYKAGKLCIEGPLAAR